VTFAQRREHWLKALSGEDRHSIKNQLWEMTFDLATFDVINEARRLAPPAQEGGVQLNGLMHRFLNRGFFNSQMVAVRRLCDTYDLEGKKSVYSLTGLLKDMQKHVKLFTRESIFRAEGLEYDPGPTRQRYDKYALERENAGERVHCISDHLDWTKIEARHEEADRLAGITRDKRAAHDTISEMVFNNLLKKVEAACQDIRKYVDKFIAHAATPKSRETIEADKLSITLKHIREAHQQLCQVTHFLSVYVLGDACIEFLATPQYDQFKYIERPLISDADKENLRKVWRDFHDQCNQSNQWGLDEFDQEFINKTKDMR